MKQCKHCKETKPFSEFHQEQRNAPISEIRYRPNCKDCRRVVEASRNTNRMFINGKYIPTSHPLYKPGKYKSLDDAWGHLDIDTRSTEGEVYILQNPAWDGWFKVGKAVDSKDRLLKYQTSSPFRDYVLLYSESFDNRHKAEPAIHSLLRKHQRCYAHKKEWFKTDVGTIKEVMYEYRNQDTGAGYRNEQSTQHDLALCDTGC
jgi:hypothetical protein|tara:strand:+ start:3487 stop:4095 length:609 start_codon:yes stop_codon:yes gene_type:complete